MSSTESPGTHTTAQPSILYAHNAGAQQVTSSEPTLIEGLRLTLPPAVRGASALVTLSVTAPFAKGGSAPGINFYIDVEGEYRYQGCFTAVDGSETGRSPITMVAQVPLRPEEQTVVAQWSSIRGATGVIDDLGYASLSAVIA